MLSGVYCSSSRRAYVELAGINRPISVYRLGEMPIQSCGQKSALRAGKRAPGAG